MYKTHEFKLLAISIFLYAAFLLYLIVCLKFNMFVSDVHRCWTESLRWKTPYDPYWAPGYPLLLAAIRGLTFNMLQPLQIMWLVSLVAYIVSVITVYRFAAYEKYAYPLRLAVLFAIFPFVGVIWSVYPTSDISAIAFMLLAMYAYRKEQWIRFAIFAGGAMFFQKLLWFFVPLLAVVAFIQYKQARAWIPLAFVPITVWAVSGAFYYQDLFWCLHTELLTSLSSLPVFDGLITPFFSGVLLKFVKGTFIASIFACAVYGMYYSFINKLWLSLCTCLSLAIMCTVINSYEIWAVARYSKLLIIPFCMIAHHSAIDRLHLSKTLLVTIIAVCIVTNLGFGYYLSAFPYK